MSSRGFEGSPAENPNLCTDPYTPSFWLGKPGALVPIRMPDAGYQRGLNDNFAVHNMLEGQGVDRSPYQCRTWTFQHQWLTPDVMSVLMEFATRQRGIGPFILVDPHAKNLLTPNQASGTDALHTTEGFSVEGATPVVVIDTWSRDITGGFGTADTGQVYTLSDTASDYNVPNFYGSIQPSATNDDRIAYIFADSGTDRTVQVEGAFTTLPGSNLLRFAVIPRLVDTSNYYSAALHTSSSGTPTFTVRKRVAGVNTVLDTIVGPVNVTSPIVAGTYYTVKCQIIGSSIKARVWETGVTEPTTWDSEVTDTSLPTGTYVGVFARDETVVFTHEVRFDNFISTSESVESLESSTDTFVQGERSLKWTLPASTLFGVLTLDTPTGLHGWATPPGSYWAFSGHVRGGGTDPFVTMTPRLVWKDISGAQSSPAVSGTSFITTDLSTQSFCVTGTAPGNGLVTAQLITSSASVTGVAEVYVDQLQLEILDPATVMTTCTQWEYGQGQALVGVRSDTETIPRVLRTNVDYIAVEVT